jgi:hypothetical protein
VLVDEAQLLTMMRVRESAVSEAEAFLTGGCDEGSAPTQKLKPCILVGGLGGDDGDVLVIDALSQRGLGNTPVAGDVAMRDDGTAKGVGGAVDGHVPTSPEDCVDVVVAFAIDGHVALRGNQGPGSAVTRQHTLAEGDVANSRDGIDA